jgi:hypothetical protein
MLPPCGTKSAWRQALLGRSAIAGCAPMPPRFTLCAPRSALCPVLPPSPVTRHPSLGNWTLSPAGNSSKLEHNNDKNKKVELYFCKNENLYLVFFGFFDIIYAAVTNSRHEGKREPLGRVESKPESASLPAGVSRMCVFPAPNSARFAGDFPLFTAIYGYLHLFTPVPRAFFSHVPATLPSGPDPPACWLPWRGRIPLQREKTARPLDQPFALSGPLFALDPRLSTLDQSCALRRAPNRPKIIHHPQKKIITFNNF